jgi:flagellar basal body-associated protein FliL
VKTNVKKKKNIVLIAVLIAVVVLCIVAVIVLLLSSGGKEKKLKEQLALGDRYLSEMDYEKAIRAYKEALNRSGKRRSPGRIQKRL